MLGIMSTRFTNINDAGQYVTDPAELNEMNKNAAIWKPYGGGIFTHSWAIEDGSFLRINNITFGYSLDKRLLSKINVKNLRIYATVNNLYTFTKYTGYDPEVNVNNNPLTPGLDFSSYPRSRAILFGVNVSL